MKTFEFKGEKIFFEKSSYANNGSLAVSITCEDGEPFATLTVNLSYNLKGHPRQAFIDIPNLDWDGEDSLQWLIDKGLVVDTGFRGTSGYCVMAYPLVEFTDRFFELFKEEK